MMRKLDGRTPRITPGGRRNGEGRVAMHLKTRRDGSRRPPLAVATLAGALALTAVAALRGALPAAADEDWRAVLKQQLQSQYGCRLDRFVFEREVPLGRLVSAREDAEFAAYLCSEQANCFVGQVFPVCGGWVQR